uniref:Uncharacterized protein n=1 Tax=Caenorhabditis japonica TaxID=281687 RepID=A0A8R1HQB7_CAEJA
MTAVATTCKLLLTVSLFGAVAATWSMSGYACNQPQLYSQCNCPSFCSGYMQPQYQYQQPCGYSGGCGGGGGGGGGYYPRRRHHHKHKKPRRKFRFDEDEDDEENVALPPPPPPRKSKVSRVKSEEEGFIEERRVSVASKSDRGHSVFVFADSHRDHNAVEFPSFSETLMQEKHAHTEQELVA